MALTPWVPTAAQSGIVLGSAVAIPAANGQAVLQLDDALFLSALTSVTYGFEISRDGGATWSISNGEGWYAKSGDVGGARLRPRAISVPLPGGGPFTHVRHRLEIGGGLVTVGSHGDLIAAGVVAVG
jgi:hypothetical protein